MDHETHSQDNVQEPEVSPGAVISMVYGEQFNSVESYTQVNQMLNDADLNGFVEFNRNNQGRGLSRVMIRPGAVIRVDEITDRMWETLLAEREQAEKVQETSPFPPGFQLFRLEGPG